MPARKTAIDTDGSSDRIDLMDAISQIQDDAVRHDLKKWVQEFDFKAVESLEDIAAAYALHYRLVLYVAPKYDHLLKTLTLAQKTLDAFAKAYKDYLEIDFPGQIQQWFEKEVRAQRESLRKVLNPDQYARFERYVDEALAEKTERAHGAAGHANGSGQGRINRAGRYRRFRGSATPD